MYLWSEPCISVTSQRVPEELGRGHVGTESQRCMLCRGAMRPWLRVPDDAKQSRAAAYDVYWCDTCAYGAVQPIPSVEQVAEFYRLDRYYTQGESHYEAEGEKGLLDQLRTHVAWRLDRGTPLAGRAIHEALGRKPSRIIDIGCGNGQIAAELATLGHSIVGVEVDPNAISRRLRERGLEVLAGSAEILPPELAPRSFDCVVMNHVLEHCRDPLLALQNARSLLKPGGRLLCEVPNNAAAALEHVGSAWEMLDVPRHLHFFTQRSLQRACEAAGLRVKGVKFGYYRRQFTNAWINTERRLWSNLMGARTAASPAPAQNSKLRAWRLLLKTFAAPAERKYDSVNVTAVQA